MKIKKIDIRHVIAVSITLGMLAFAVFGFPTALPRFVESCKDLGSSVVYYFKEILSIENDTVPTVVRLSDVKFRVPFGLPQTWEEFTALWNEFWKIFFTKENFSGYLTALGDFVYNFSRVLLLIGVPVILIAVVVFKRYVSTQNNKYNADSKPLKAFKAVVAKVYVPVKKRVVGFIEFLKVHDVYLKLWLAIWAWNFNIIVIAIEFFAYYFYFVVTFEFVGIYRQVFKLLCDLSIALDTIPLWLWCIIGYVILCKVRRKLGFERLRHYERKNCGFINERPIVLMVCGTMGKKKTTLITDMALSEEVLLRDKAFEKILENDLKFPHFPWINLENDLKRQMRRHKVYNLASVKEYVGERYMKWHRRKSTKNLYDYDYETYGLFYDDGLQLTSVWETIATYAQLYFIYVIECSLIISNYSIRTDNLMDDIGNFPLWNSDFFERDSRLIDSYSRHSHIIDFDALRLGRKVIEDNPNQDSFEFGVINLTEVGKERKNNLELRETKRNEETTNQKNDGFNDWLKMVRHSATVDKFPFVKVITDEQRPESWGADARDLCEIVRIDDASEFRLCMPFFTITETLYESIYKRFEGIYRQYRYMRGDNTLFMYLLKGIASRFNAYVTEIRNTFGVSTVNVVIESGTMNGESKAQRYYLMSKKIYSKRFSTDCFSDFFMQKALKSNVGIADLSEYATEKATFEELKTQNSYFMNDLISRSEK